MARTPKKTSKKSPSAKANKPKQKPIARTALGEEPVKRGLKRSQISDAEQQSNRKLFEKVKSARGRKLSSTMWLQRQLNDPYVARARAEGYRSRAAYKLIEIHEKFNILKKGVRVVDLGAAPGGWCQVAVAEGGKNAKVVGIDYLGMEPVDGADVLEMDFLDDDAPDRLKELLGGKADVVLSDMAAPTTGHKQTDHLNIVNLVEVALQFADEVLEEGGHFAAKTFQGGATNELVDLLKKKFKKVQHFKPKSSRPDSAEMYVVAMGYRG